MIIGIGKQSGEFVESVLYCRVRLSHYGDPWESASSHKSTYGPVECWQNAVMKRPCQQQSMGDTEWNRSKEASVPKTSSIRRAGNYKTFLLLTFLPIFCLSHRYDIPITDLFD